MQYVKCWMLVFSFVVQFSACKKPAQKQSGQPEGGTQVPLPGATGPNSTGQGTGNATDSGGVWSGNSPGGGSGGPSTDPSASPSTTPSGGGSGGNFGGNGPGKFIPDFEYSSEFFTLNDKFKMGNSPHKNVRIWYSKNLKDGVNQNNFDSVPVGSVAIKEFDNDGTPGLDGFAVMIKEERGYDSANGDWSYELRDKWGDIQNNQRGRVKLCSDCHAKFKSTDYLGGTKFSGASGGGTGGLTDPQNSGEAGPGAFDSKYATSSMFFTNMTSTVAGDSDSPHRDIQIWYSKNIQSLVGSGDSFNSVPVGTVAVKRYVRTRNNKTGSCFPAPGLAVMVKQSASGTNNGWKFEIRNSLGVEVPNCGNELQACASCHVQATRNFLDRKTDYLMGTEHN